MLSDKKCKNCERQGKKMGELLNLDNPFFRGIGKLVDCIFVSLLWFLCSIPVVTIGASTTALYYTVHKSIRRGQGYVSKEFFRAFKENFKQSTVVWLIWLVLAAFLGLDAYIMWHYAAAGHAVGSLYYLFLVFLMFLVMWATYLFPYIARFENQTKVIMKNAALIAIANIGWTLVLFLLTLVFAVITFVVPLVLFLFTGLLIFTQSLILEKIFRKYMTEEDLASEDEKNHEFLQ